MKTPLIIRPIKTNITLPEDLYARLKLYLYSEVEGKVPWAAYQRFFIDRINEFFDSQYLDLSGLAELPQAS